MFDKVCGSNQIRERFSKNYHFDDIKDYWYKDVEDFKNYLENIISINKEQIV